MSIQLRIGAASAAVCLLWVIDSGAQTRAVDVTVLDDNGQIVTNLTPSDFVIEEAGMIRPIEKLESPSARWNILFLLDSAVISSRGLAPALSHLSSRDRFAIGVFSSGRISLNDDWRDGQDTGPYRVPEDRFVVDTAEKDLYGALQWGVRRLNEVRGRKMIVVITDGHDRGLAPRLLTGPSVRGIEVLDPLFGLPDAAEEREFIATLDRVRESGIRYHFLTNGGNRPFPTAEAKISALYPGGERATDAYFGRIRERLEKLAGASGGRVHYAEGFAEFLRKINGLVDDLGLGATYSIEYSSHRSNSGPRDPVVRIIDPKLRVFVRGSLNQ